MPRVFAFYLPQFHPFTENDRWWGKGFTEWTNVTKALPLFRGHYQPRFPADLGFYDLRVAEVREAQADLAKNAGIEGFVYYHYWFGAGKQLMTRPFEEVLKEKKPDFPFMLCWANETWKGVWMGTSKGKVLMEQFYPGPKDYINHFKYLLAAFMDQRYVTIDGKPVFIVYRPQGIPNLDEFVTIFREQAFKAGLKGIYLLAGDLNVGDTAVAMGFDGVISNNFHKSRFDVSLFDTNRRGLVLQRVFRRINRLVKNPNPEQRKTPLVLDYEKFTRMISRWPDVGYDYYPQIIPDWDNSPRAGRQSLILKGSTPERWRNHVQEAVIYSKRHAGERNIIFIKSWNEWAEGNYLEPDQKWGHAYLEELEKALSDSSSMK